MQGSDLGPRILVVGCGAIGGVVAAHLAELDHDVSVLTTNPRIAIAVRDSGFRVRHEAIRSVVRARAVIEALTDAVDPFHYVLLATQPPQVEQAAREALPWLREDGRIVCFQNGLCEPRVAAIAGEPRVIGAVVAWGASMIEPGVYDRTSPGGFSIGYLDGRIDGHIDDLGRLLESIGPTTITQNLLGARWSKLAINCAISTLGTIGGQPLGSLLRKRFVRRLGLEIMTEVVEVARAEGVRLEKVAGTVDLEWLALRADERVGGSPRLLAKHSLLLAVGARYRRLRSSMLAAILRGRPPAVDFLNGEVVERAARRGLSTPVNQAARDLVWAIARGEREPSNGSLRLLYERTRTHPELAAQ
jgi:2-dehydropantoate 2-reductase